jgi:hypothetical protein
MRRLLLIGFTIGAFVLAPNMSATAMPVATPNAFSAPEGAIIQVHGHGHHYGWGRGRGHHYGWRHHHRHW